MMMIVSGQRIGGNEIGNGDVLQTGAGVIVIAVVVVVPDARGSDDGVKPSQNAVVVVVIIQVVVTGKSGGRYTSGQKILE